MALGGSRQPDGLDLRPVAEINVTPLVDVMLVLLIIFMVAAPMLVQGVPLELPKTTGSTLAETKKPVIVSLVRDGGIFVRDTKVASADLEADLAALRSKEGDAVVYVRGDRGVPYGDVMDLLGRVGASGYARVSLLAEAKADPSR